MFKFFDRKKGKKAKVVPTPSVPKPVSPPQNAEPPVFLNQIPFSIPSNPTDIAPSRANAVPDVSDHTHFPTLSPSASDENPDLQVLSPPSPPPVDVRQSILDGAKNFKIENSILTNIHGTAMIFKFDGGSPPNEEFKTIFTNSLAGLITVQDLDRVEKRVLTQVVRALPRADAAYNDYTSRDRRRTTCFEGTRRALLEEMATWVIDRDNSPVYVLFGPAGMGKSTVAHTIAARADNLRSLGASFFFSRDEIERRNAKRFFTSIAFQLCVFDKEFAQAIGNALTEETGAAASSKEPLEQLERLILEPLRPVVSKRSLHVLIIVDALDECEEEDGQIVVKGLSLLVKELRSFKVILTTRPQPHLQHFVKRLVAHRVFHLQNIEDKIVDGDIRLYLKYNLSLEQVGDRLPDLEPWGASDAEIEELVQAVGRLFIIASTTILFILDKTASDPASQMEKLLNAFSHDRTPLNTLNNFYTVILRNAVPPDSDPDLIDRYQEVIGTIVTIQEPLPIEALALLIGLSSKSIRAVLGNLQSVILFGSDDNIPRVYHKSFPDYITDSRRCKEKDLLIVPSDHHTRIATQCLRIMNKHLKRNILGLNGLTQYLNNDKALEEESISENKLDEKIPQGLRYACVYWANHVQSANTQDPDLVRELKTFAEEHIPHWFEALSWIKRLDVAHRALSIILKFLTSMSEMRDIFSDALRFSARFFGSIQESALHAYHSAISFTPTGSRLYKKYQKETIHSLCQVEGGSTEWDPVIGVLCEANEDTISHIVFSQDGTRVASWTVGTVKIWDSASGTPIRAFEGDKISLSGDFSVSALLREKSVTMYSVASNAPIATFDHNTDVVELAVSFNGSRLAVGMSDGTVNLWDTETKKVIAILENYTPNRDYNDEDGDGNEDEDEDGDEGDDDDNDSDDESDDDSEDGSEDGDETGSEDDEDWYFENLRTLAFSPNGGRLAFVSHHGIELLNSVSGEFACSLDHELHPVAGFVFSGDGSRLASLSCHTPRTLRLWNNENCELLGFSKGFSEALVITADGSLLAVEDNNGDVQLWSADPFSLVKTIDVNADVISLALSNDLLAISSEGDKKVVLYDLKTHAMVAEHQIPDPVSLALSPDSTRIAAGNCWNEVHLLDVQSIKASVDPFHRDRHAIRALTFSPDSSRLASGFDDGTVQLWDTSQPAHDIATHKIHTDEIMALAFLPDGGRFASGSRDKVVRLWDGKDGSPIGALEYTFTHRPVSLAFSSILLAAGTKDGVVLWDYKSSQLVFTLPQAKADHLLFSFDGSLLAAVHNHLFTCTVWDVEKRASIATFTLDSGVDKFIFSPDNSKLASWLEDGCLTLFDVVNDTIIKDIEHEDLGWIPQLNGITVLPNEVDAYEFCLVGRFSKHHEQVPVLRFPRDDIWCNVTAGSSIFAVGTESGRILFVRPPHTCTN